jgi:hypothetical protein
MSDDDISIGYVVKVVFAALVGLAAISIVASFLGIFTGGAADAAKVVKQEIYPTALLKKYEWFKDASAALDKKRADIGVYTTRLTALEKAYEGQRRSAWPRDDREQYSIWQSELSGVKASYNSLAADYNAQMSKINWAFANVGQVPPSESPLPREYKPYETQ